jgi:hypothetical protein
MEITAQLLEGHLQSRWFCSLPRARSLFLTVRPGAVSRMFLRTASPAAMPVDHDRRDRREELRNPAPNVAMLAMNERLPLRADVNSWFNYWSTSFSCI